MTSSRLFWLACSILLSASISVAQTPQRGGRGGRGGGGGGGNTFPAQQRALADAATIERGKTLFSIHCSGCHGPDLRGGDAGGPNLLRSQIILNDQHGELIRPIVYGSRKPAMAPINIPETDVT